MRILLYLWSILLAAPLLGQSADGTLRIYVQIDAGFARVNGQVLDLNKETEVQLPAGSYEVELWAPGFVVNTVSVSVAAGEITRLRHGLKGVDPAFSQYRDELSDWMGGRRTRRMVAGTFGLATLGIGYFTILKPLRDVNEAYERIENDVAVFPNIVNVAGARNLPVTYQRHVSEYEEEVDRARTLRYIGLPLMAVTSGLGYLLTRNAARKAADRPTPDSQNPFVSVFHTARPTLAYNGRGGSFGLTLNF